MNTITVLLRPVRLRCEYLDDPLGIDVARPRLSWALTGGQDGERQSAYRVCVASSPGDLEAGQADLWDSGRVESTQTAHIRYEGAPLASGQRCWWRVQVWDGRGRPAEPSAAARWEMGLLRSEDWTGVWIAGEGASPRFRREIDLRGTPVAARLYVCGQGVCEASVNGQDVGQPLGPTLSRYPRRMFYDTLDVTDLVRTGRNTVAIWLAPGWYGDPRTRSAMGMSDAPDHALIAQLTVRFSDGTSVVVGTDESWRTAASPLTPVISHWKYCLAQSGEVYDGTREEAGWDRDGFDDSGWSPARRIAAPTAELCARMVEPNVVTEIAEPVNRARIDPGTAADALVELLVGIGAKNWGTSASHPTLARGWRAALAASIAAMGGRFLGGWELDLGRHVSGRVDLTVEARRGDWICLFGVDRHRAAGGGAETVRLHFAHRVVRFVPVLFFGQGPEPLIRSARGVGIGAGLHHTGRFSCSDEVLTRIHDLSARTWAAHLLAGMPMDSWQERFGTGLIESLEQTTWCEDVGAFFTKWTADHRDQQREDGYLPVSGGPIAFDYWSPNWSKNGLVLAPWLLYRFTGDRGILEASYPAVRRWMELCAPRDDSGRTWQPPADHGEAEAGFGDHGRPSARWYDAHTGDLFETLHTLDCFRMAREMARVLGRGEDVRRYEGIEERLVAKCNRPEFLDREAGLYGGGDQACHAMVLHLNVVPAELRKRVADHLVQDIMEKRGGHMNTGFLGTWYLLRALMDLDRPDVARLIIANETAPSWRNLLRHPESPGELTIFPEFFTGGMIPHPGLCNIGFWFYQGLGGIAPDPEHPGFQRVIVRPQVPPGLESASVEYDSIRGLISSAWRVCEDGLELTVRIPPNVTASVGVPTAESGRAWFEVGSGTHRFVAALRSSALR